MYFSYSPAVSHLKILSNVKKGGILEVFSMVFREILSSYALIISH